LTLATAMSEYGRNATNVGYRAPAQRAAAIVSQPGAAAESITLYHWLVVLFASCGWLFDTMGQRIFVLSREPALRELLGATASDDKVHVWGTLPQRS